MKWTDEQQAVLDAANQDVLVAAAAGSGKTAVMVEKILRLVMERKTDIDNILAVTFTKAAASEMKERLTKKFSEALEENPDDEYFYKQICFVANSKITTIDSFCSWVVKRFYNLTDLDPLFRVADETETKLLISDSFNELIKDIAENIDEEKQDDVYNVLSFYTSAKKSEELEKRITELLKYSKAYINPEEWLDNCSKSYEYESFEAFKKSDLVKDIIELTNEKLAVEYEKMKKAMEVIQSEELFVEKYGDKFSGYLKAVKQVSESKSYDEIYNILLPLKFSDGQRAPKGLDEEWSIVKGIRDNAFAVIVKLRSSFFEQPLKDYYEDIKCAKRDVDVIIYLCKQLDERYSRYKKLNNIVDFDDISHSALNILVKYNEETGEYERTDIAYEISKEFKYTFIDEYQDSNEVQETILAAVSHRDGKRNRFMVGDVKQSIYGFRNSNPKIFMDKYESYSDDVDAEERRIFLDQNFRSRDNVLQFVNYIFKQVMIKDIGDVDYDEKNFLRYGADYAESYAEGVNDTEIYVLSEEANSDERAYNESKMVAARIKQLINPENPYKVFDRKLGEKGEYRNIRLSDIAILCRTGKYDSTLMKTLAEFGIESFSQKTLGYFDSEEITLLLSILDIVDNPYNDIKLLTVMKSKLYEFTDLELSLMKIKSNKKSFYNNVLAYIDNGDDVLLKNKIEAFVEEINYFREQTNYMSIYELIDLILEETGLLYLAKSMPAGRVRLKNIEMLKEMALTYEHSSYKGLFNFIRYINKQKNYDIDVGGSLDVNENDDAVRIMTIHKSKGLQFPVVFLFGTGKSYNTMDENNNIILDRKLGIGVPYNDSTLKIKADTLNKKRIKKKLNTDMKGEELRLLYVALTRAEEKLIITGSVKKREALDDVFSNGSDNTFIQMPAALIEDSNSYLDIIGLAMSRHRCLLGKVEGYEFKTDNQMYMDSRNFGASFDFIEIAKDEDDDKKLNIIDTSNEELAELMLAGASAGEEDNTDDLKFDGDATKYKDMVDKIKSNFEYVYPYKLQTYRKTKESISEIKRAYYEELIKETEDEKVFTEKVYPVKPKFISNEDDKSGAYIGTMYHRIFELFDYSIDFDKKVIESGDYTQIEDMIDEFSNKGLIDKEQFKEVTPNVFARFILSPLYDDLKKAYEDGSLKREQKFIFTSPACKISKQYKDDDPILIQGIIDAFYERDGRITIIDYKSDRVDNFEELKNKYEIQLWIYRMAVSQIYDTEDVDCYIYSTYLGDCIKV